MRLLSRHGSTTPSGRSSARPRRDGRRRLIGLIGLVGLALSTSLLAGPSTAAASGGREYHRVGYYTQWSLYRGFVPKNLATSGAAARLTHINYAFGNVSADGECFIENAPGLGDAWADYQRPYPAGESVDGAADVEGQALAGNFNQLRKLKQRHPNLKVLISLGGWTWSRYFSDAALTPESRRRFVSSCIELYLAGNLPAADGRGGPGSAAGLFDGIDLDWEWPGWPAAPDTVFRPEDRQNFTALLAEFRRQLDAFGDRNGRHFLLTTFLPANPGAMDAGFEGRRIFRYLDYATFQGYDFHGTWTLVTNHQSAIREPRDAPESPDFTVDRTVRDWTVRGAPRHKLVLGVPYYGRGWTGVPAVNRGLFQPATGPAPSTLEPGYENFRELDRLRRQGFEVHRDVRSGFAWLFDGTTFWTYDDPFVIAQKTLYIRRAGLGGAMVWSLDGDTDRAALTRALAHGLG